LFFPGYDTKDANEPVPFRNGRHILVNAHQEAEGCEDNQCQQKTRSLLVSRLTDLFIFYDSQSKPGKDTKRQGTRGQIVDKTEFEKLSTNKQIKGW
jgi:hypothetical protein